MHIQPEIWNEKFCNTSNYNWYNVNERLKCRAKQIIDLELSPHCTEATARVARWNTVAVQTREILQVRDHLPVVPVATAANGKPNP